MADFRLVPVQGPGRRSVQIQLSLGAGTNVKKKEAKFSETRKTKQNSVKSNDNMIPQLPQLMIYMTHVHPILSMDAFGSSFHLL